MQKYFSKENQLLEQSKLKIKKKSKTKGSLKFKSKQILKEFKNEIKVDTEIVDIFAEKKHLKMKYKIRDFYDFSKDTKICHLGFNVENHMLRGFENTSIIIFSDDQEAITDTSYE